MKDYAIIEDDKKKYVVPFKWLSENLQFVRWPNTKDMAKIKKAVIDLADPQKDWDEFDDIRFIKTKGILFLLIHRLYLMCFN